MSGTTPKLCGLAAGERRPVGVEEEVPERDLAEEVDRLADERDDDARRREDRQKGGGGEQELDALLADRTPRPARAGATALSMAA